MSNFFRNKNNLDRKFNTQTQQILLNSPDITNNPQRKEIVKSLLDEYNATVPNVETTKGSDFENFVFNKFKDLRAIQAEKPAGSILMSDYGVEQVFEKNFVVGPKDFLTVKDESLPSQFTPEAIQKNISEQNPAAIAVGYSGVSPFFLGKGVGTSMDIYTGFPHNNIIYPKDRSITNPTSLPDLGYFGHFRKLNINAPYYATLIDAFDNTIPNTMFVFEVQQDLYKTRSIQFPVGSKEKNMQTLHAVKAPPTGLELKVYTLLNKGILNNDRIQTELGKLHMSGQMLRDTQLQTSRTYSRDINDVAQGATKTNYQDLSTLGITDFMNNVARDIYENYYFKDGKVNPNFLQEVNSLDPYSFFSKGEAFILKRDYPLTLQEKVITVGGKNSDVIATSHIVEAAIKRAINDGNKYVAFPMVDAAAKINEWQVTGNKDMKNFSQAFLKNSDPYIKDFYDSGVGNKINNQQFINFDIPDEVSHLDTNQFNGFMVSIENISQTTYRRKGAAPKNVINNQTVINTYEGMTDEQMTTSRRILANMEFIQMAIKGTMPDTFNMSVENTFNNTIIIGKEKVKLVGDDDFILNQDSPYLQISKEAQEKFKTPEFILSLMSDNDMPDGMHETILKTIFGTDDARKMQEEARKILQGKVAHIDAFDNNVKKEYERMLDVQNQNLVDSGGQKIASPEELRKLEQLKNYTESDFLRAKPYSYSAYQLRRPDFIRDSVDDIKDYIDSTLSSGPSASEKYASNNAILSSLTHDIDRLKSRYTVAKSLLKNNNFFTKSYKSDLGDAYKQTKFGGLVRTYTDTIPNLFKRAGVETRTVKVPEEAIEGKTNYAEEELSNFLQVELTPENIKKLQDYKTNMYTNSILPRVSKEEENNKKTIFGPLSPSQKMFMDMGLLDAQLGS